MLKKEIRYTNFNGDERIKTYYFNISKAEIIEMENEVPGGYGEFLKGIIAQSDGRQLITEFKRFVLAAVGLRSEDGERFIKNDAIREEFMQTPAYETLFMEMISDFNAAANFIKGVFPKEFADMMDAQQLPSGVQVVSPTSTHDPSAFMAPPPPPPPADTPISH